MHDNRRILEDRINRELHERVRPAELGERVPLDVTAFELPGEPVPVDEIDTSRFESIERGSTWGRPWGTTWFRATGEVPARLVGTTLEVVAELGFTGSMAGFQAEGAVYVDARIRSGLHPRRRAIPLEIVSHGARIDFLVEAASNPDFTSSFGPTPMGSLSTAGDAPLYVFGGIDLVVVQPEVRALAREVRTLNALMRTLPVDHPRRQRLLHVFQRAFDSLDLADVARSGAAARAELADGFDLPAAPGAHHLSAVGHAHIDTAWLWPLRETRRKCARTFANQVQLLDAYPEHRFAASQAAQYAWVAEDHPELFHRISEKVAARQWVPVGGMWVEADMNLPSGESLVRQLVHGQRWFEHHFGLRCREVWIPDVFGYPGSLPQIFAAGGCHRFVTQKLSWNKQNRFPHHTFWWEGIDGTTVLAHFPPVETYNAELQPVELAHAAASFSEHYWSDHSLVPFGHGDGGGGPTREMLERGRLLADVAGLPRLAISDPDTFFGLVEAEAARSPVPRWRGELYFEMHRGTFTTQAETKVGNRRCEQLLREAELWLATLGDASHAAELDALWKRVLTQQFHDILPGSSIAWVHEDAECEHTAVQTELESIIGDALHRLTPAGPHVANAATHRRREIVHAAGAPDGGGRVQQLADGSRAFVVEAPGLGIVAAVAHEEPDMVEVSTDRLANSSLDVRFDHAGNITSVRDLRHDRELVPPGRHAGELTLAPDHPVEYDAWDLEQWTAALARPLPAPSSVEVVDAGPLVGSVRVRREFGDSWVEQTITLRAGSARLDVGIEVEWQAIEQLLAIEFPFDVRTDSAACEVQFGHEHRPTHANTSWDDAKFEVCAQRFVDMSEATFGVAVLNDGRYGHAVQGGGVRVSLLRSPRYPDPDADRGRHHTTVALLPHGPGLTEVLSEAEALNLPLRVYEGGSGTDDPRPVVSVDDPRVLVSAVKLADDGSGDLVVRMWEATGDRVPLRVRVPRAVRDAAPCNLLEEPLTDGSGPAVTVDDGTSALELRPFQLVTLRLTSR